LHWRTTLVTVAFPILLAGFLGLPKVSTTMTWRDAVALALITAAYFLHWFQPGWPDATSAMFSKLFLADVALYCFLVARRLDGMGYSLVPSRATVWIGIREWLFYFPFALVIGGATGFIHLHELLSPVGTALGTVGFTFLLIALPEEMFFRGILQNLLESRLGRTGALIVASVLFGLSHFNHGSPFNWRYVLLATIAGLFYGRAWRAERQIFAAVMTHTLVDVVWWLWFR
jgi:membrane protease YdiL (CAAX protease family)